MSSEKIQRERELFEQYKKQRAPGANLQRIGAEYVDLDVQWHFETWLARANMCQPASPAPCTSSDSWNCKYCPKTATRPALKDPRTFGDPKPSTGPVATILPPDPLDERSGPWLSLEDWERLRALPSGTRLYAAPAVQGEVGEGVPDYINDAIDNLAHANYELSYAGYQEYEKDIALIRAYIARTGQAAEQQPAPDVAGLVEALSESLKGIEIPSTLTPARAEFFKAGVHAAVNRMNTVLADYQQGGEE